MHSHQSSPSWAFMVVELEEMKMIIAIESIIFWPVAIELLLAWKWRRLWPTQRGYRTMRMKQTSLMQRHELHKARASMALVLSPLNLSACCGEGFKKLEEGRTEQREIRTAHHHQDLVGQLVWKLMAIKIRNKAKLQGKSLNSWLETDSWIADSYAMPYTAF